MIASSSLCLRPVGLRPVGLRLVAISASLALPHLMIPAARADVLEVGPSGHVWIAGGPAPTLTDPQADASGDAREPVARSFTAVGMAAGPDAWRGHVAAIAAKYDISPALLEAVVWQESRWNPNAVSRAGARGLAQLMPETGRTLGVDWRNPLSNLEGGAHYLRQQLDRFGGDIERALAAYNAGPTRVERAGGIPAISETRAYVASIMARLAQPVRR